MTTMSRPAQGHQKACPNWCCAGHSGAAHRSAPYSFATGCSMLVVRGGRPSDGPAVVRVLSDGRALDLSPAQARQLAADLREYAELASFAEEQWRWQEQQRNRRHAAAEERLTGAGRAP